MNSGPPVPQTGALTGLRYAPTDAEIISFTRIGRNKLTGEEARTDVSQSQQIVKQLRVELEELMRILRR